MVARQDIPLWRNCPPIFRNYKCFFPPATDSYRPPVATHVHETLLTVISVLPLFFERGDLMAVNFHSPEGLFDTSHNLFRLYNAYSIPSSHTRSVSPVGLFPWQDFPTLVLGELNIQHSTSHPTRLLSDYDQFISSPYFDRASAQLYFLLNTPGVYNRFPFTSNHHPAVLDLSFANSALFLYFSCWNPSLQPTGSDHTALTIILSTPLLKPPPRGLTSKLHGLGSHLPSAHQFDTCNPLRSLLHHEFTLGGGVIPPLQFPSLRFIPLGLLHSGLMDFVFF